MASTVFHVSTAAELKSAMAKASGGDTILLDEGDYGSLTLTQRTDFDYSYDSPVTIRSADPGHPASFSGMDVRDAANITIDSVVFDYTFTEGDDGKTRPFELTNSRNITISNSVFDGDVASGVSSAKDGYGVGVGFAARGCTDLTFSDNEIKSFHVAASITSSSDVIVSGNDVHDIRMDGLKFSEVTNILIEDNYVHDFKGALDTADHRDFIQLFTAGTKIPSTNITIRGNTLDIGNGSFAQSIFMRNDLVDTGQAGSEMYFRNVVIENNAIYNNQVNGIVVGATDGLTIRNNTVLQADGAGDKDAGTGAPRIEISEESSHVTIQNNVISGQIKALVQAGWTISDNLMIQNRDTSEPNHYSQFFISSSLTNPDGSHSYVVLPGSVIETSGLGAQQMLLDDAPDSVLPLFQISSSPASDTTVIFDAAAYTTGPQGLLASDDARFLWDFGDGTVGEGGLVSHHYAQPGNYAVTLRVVETDGTTTTTIEPLVLQDSNLLAFDASTRSFIAEGDGSETSLSIAETALTGTGTATALDLGGKGTVATVTKAALIGLFGADNFDISLQLKADAGKLSYGEVFRLHQTFVASVDSSGAFVFSLTTADGKTTTVKTAGTTLLDGKLHSVSIDFDADQGTLQVSVDGHVAGSAAVSGDIGSAGAWDLAFGNSWGRKNFEGTLKSFDIDVDRATAHYDSYTGTGTPIDTSDGTPDNLPTLDDYVFGSDQIGAITAASAAVRVAAGTGASPVLAGDAHVVTENGEYMIALDGDGDRVNIGRLTKFEQSEKIAFSVDFRRDAADNSDGRIAGNPEKVMLFIDGDGFILRVATADEGFKAYKVADVGLNDTDWHNAVVIMDQASDHLQVIIDDKVVLEDTGTDLSFVGAGEKEWGWKIGGSGQTLDGTISDFRVDDDVNFVHTTSALASDAPLSS